MPVLVLLEAGSRPLALAAVAADLAAAVEAMGPMFLRLVPHHTRRLRTLALPTQPEVERPLRRVRVFRQARL